MRTFFENRPHPQKKPQKKKKTKDLYCILRIKLNVTQLNLDI